MRSRDLRAVSVLSLFGATLLGVSGLATTARGEVTTLPINRCLSRKINAVGKSLAARTACFAKEAATGIAVPACHQAASDKFTGGAAPTNGAFSKIEVAYPVGSLTACLTFDDQDSMETGLVDYAASVPSATGSAIGKCDAAKIRCVGKYVNAVARCAAKAAIKTGVIDAACTSVAAGKLANGATGCLDLAALGADCSNSGSQAPVLRADADAFLQASLCALDSGNAGCPMPAPEALSLAVVSVESTGPGQTPQLVFTVLENDLPVDILAQPLARLVLTIAGPTTDYATYWQHTIQGSGSVGTLAVDAAGFRYTLPAPMPADATGSYAFGLEGYIEPEGPGGPRYASRNPVVFGAVTDPAPVPRRLVATDAKCDSCHGSLTAHGGTRRSVDYCALCHNPNKVNDQRVARFENGSINAMSESMSFLMHRIHMGTRLTQPFVVGGFPSPTKANPAGTPIDYNLIVYPGDVRDCKDCHMAGTYRLPLASDLLPVVEWTTLQCVEDPVADADDYCDARVVTQQRSIAAETAACIGCHDLPVTSAHAETMTTADGVATCSVCHGPGRSSDAEIYHGQ